VERTRERKSNRVEKLRRGIWPGGLSKSIWKCEQDGYGVGMCKLGASFLCGVWSVWMREVNVK
jgi:hypothetical protein